jgi:hypothetical protein
MSINRSGESWSWTNDGIWEFSETIVPGVWTFLQFTEDSVSANDSGHDLIIGADLNAGTLRNYATFVLDHLSIYDGTRNAASTLDSACARDLALGVLAATLPGDPILLDDACHVFE